jgi:hypothetical protein
MDKRLISIVGWYGVIAIVGAYVLVSLGAVAAKSLTYQILNLTGAIGIVIEAATKKDRQPVVLNVVWALVAFVAIVQLLIFK